MAAARPRIAEGHEPMNDPGPGGPAAFRSAVAALEAARPRREVLLSPMPPPRRPAPFAHAVAASVLLPTGAGHPEEDHEVADGRFVLLHDPAGQEGWNGPFRVVTLTRAELEPELGTDPLLPEVAWSWLTEALEARAPGSEEPSGTVTRSGSYFFGGLADRRPRVEIEVRASWSPGDPWEPGDHLLAWCALLAQCAGLPPESGTAGVTALPRRRGPRSGR
ncbi:DUF3000 family protein [Streptomyces calidiresistens]|uniref:DUF3000 family protein n=2 Tax=Streptomyces calidiresistens TaxID=1485586 RepID=A0A7W3T8V9_9ACTN|nr:DUF3000 family protein [Streptomyces calidiresistens]